MVEPQSTMPVLPSDPGVYVREVPSNVHTIVGLPTAITVFVGRTQGGPVNTAVTVTSLADFQGQFGGVDATLPMTFAVRDFYLNGGGQAIIVRLFEAPVAAAQLDSRLQPELRPLQGAADSQALKPATYVAAFSAALDPVDLFNLLCIPPDQPGGDTDPGVYQAAPGILRSAGGRADRRSTGGLGPEWHDL